jgi:hypothetical protein
MLLDVLLQESFDDCDIENHFQDKNKYLKECLETESVFQLLATRLPVQLIGLACGNFVDVKKFPLYFPHPDSRVFGVDQVAHQLIQSYHKHQHVSFSQMDLFQENLRLKCLLQTKTHWIAIHACRNLAFQIVRLFNLWAHDDACLLLLPCCHAGKKETIKVIGYEAWKQVRVETKQQIRNGKNNKMEYINVALTSIRNSLLQKESPWFQQSFRIPAIPSVHNFALFYHKKTST